MFSIMSIMYGERAKKLLNDSYQLSFPAGKGNDVKKKSNLQNLLRKISSKLFRRKTKATNLQKNNKVQATKKATTITSAPITPPTHKPSTTTCKNVAQCLERQDRADTNNSYQQQPTPANLLQNHIDQVDVLVSEIKNELNPVQTIVRIMQLNSNICVGMPNSSYCILLQYLLQHKLRETEQQLSVFETNHQQLHTEQERAKLHNSQQKYANSQQVQLRFARPQHVVIMLYATYSTCKWLKLHKLCSVRFNISLHNYYHSEPASDDSTIDNSWHKRSNQIHCTIKKRQKQFHPAVTSFTIPSKTKEPIAAHRLETERKHVFEHVRTTPPPSPAVTVPALPPASAQISASTPRQRFSISKSVMAYKCDGRQMEQNTRFSHSLKAKTIKHKNMTGNGYNEVSVTLNLNIAAERTNMLYKCTEKCTSQKSFE